MTDPIALYLPEFTPNLPSPADMPARFVPPRLRRVPETAGEEAGFEVPDGPAPDFEAPDFGSDDAEPLDFAGGEGDEPALPVEEEPPPAVKDIEARLAQAREEALAEAAVATEAALAAQAAELETRQAEALGQAIEEERRRWAEQEGETIARQLREGLAAIETLLAETVADILKPVLDKATRAQAAEELREAVTQILATPDAPMIRIGGPGDLVEPLRAAFSAEAAIEIVDSDEAEVTVAAGDTTIRTQLQAWADTLDSHLGEAS